MVEDQSIAATIPVLALQRGSVMNSFYEHHKDSIRWHYRCFDRILLNGLIQPFQQPERVVGFFNTYRQLYPVTRYTLTDIADQFQRWVNERAAKRNIPIVEAPKGRRDEFVEPYFERAKPDEVVVILKAREPARIMIAIGDKVANRWHLQFAQRWVIQYNFYINDRNWGRMFVRICPYLPFSARVCLNQHHWLANRMREKGIGLQAMRQCLPEMRGTRSPAGARRLAHSSRSGDLRPKVARAPHTLLHRKRARTCRLPASPVLLASRVLRQPRLPSSRRAGQARRASARRQSNHRTAEQDHHDLRPQGHQALSRQAANRDRRHAPAQPGDPQPLSQRLHQAIRSRSPHPANRAGEQQRQRLRRQQSGRKSPCPPRDPVGDQRQLPQRPAGHSGDLCRSRPAAKARRTDHHGHAESAFPASSSITLGNLP